MYQHTRLFNTETNVPWEIMHRFVAFGAQTEVLRDGPYGQPVNAIGWLLWGGRCKSQPVLVLENGHPQALVGVGVEGHPGQFLAMLAQSRVKADSPYQLEGEPFTVQDLINEEKLECATNIELTFELIAMSYYQNTSDTWQSHDGQEWSIARLAHEEIRQPIHTAACGGTHRLFGLSAAFKKRLIEGKPIDGDFLEAQKYIHAYQAYTLSTLMNRDGSLSTDWFRRAADNGDIERKIQTTGHMLEWLVFSLEDNRLRDPRVIHCVDFLATQIIRYPNKPWSPGPLGHASSCTDALSSTGVQSEWPAVFAAIGGFGHRCERGDAIRLGSRIAGFAIRSDGAERATAIAARFVPAGSGNDSRSYSAEGHDGSTANTQRRFDALIAQSRRITNQ